MLATARPSCYFNVVTIFLLKAYLETIAASQRVFQLTDYI